MADAIFLLRGQLRRRQPVLRHKKMRIVAKSVRAPCLVNDQPLHLPAAGGQHLRGAGQYSNAPESRRAFFKWNGSEFTDQFGAVGVGIPILLRLRFLRFR